MLNRWVRLWIVDVYKRQTYGVPIGALIMEKYLKGELSPESEAKAAERCV